MKTSTLVRRILQAAGSGLRALSLISLAFSMHAFASLGATVDSVKEDQTHLQAHLQVTTGDKYSIHELTSVHGTVVREYVSQAGKVFAVSWHGPFIPDMRQLLGVYFQQYVISTNEQRAHHTRRASLSINVQSLVLQSSGHMLSYFGRAYDPTLLPAGVNADELR